MDKNIIADILNHPSQAEITGLGYTNFSFITYSFRFLLQSQMHI